MLLALGIKLLSLGTALNVDGYELGIRLMLGIVVGCRLGTEDRIGQNLHVTGQIQGVQ